MFFFFTTPHPETSEPPFASKVDTDGSRTLDFFEYLSLSFMMTQNGAWFWGNATFRGRVSYTILDAPVLTLDVTV
jgi:hypothetical protein